MSASKRPSTSSLRRFITSRPYVPVAELRRRFGLDEPDEMVCLQHNGTTAWIGLPDREASKIQDLWDRDELGIELSVEVRAPVVVGVYPMRIARYVMDNGASGSNGHAAVNGNGNAGGVVGAVPRRTNDRLGIDLQTGVGATRPGRPDSTNAPDRRMGVWPPSSVRERRRSG